MKRVFLVACLLALMSSSLMAERRYIVRTTSGLNPLKLTCTLLGCKVQYGLDGALGQLFLVTTSDLLNPLRFLTLLLSQPGIVSAETDVLARVAQSASLGGCTLTDATPIDYFGQTTRLGYVNQPASLIIGLAETHRSFNVRGAGIVAVIDTGVDPAHPLLKGVLVPGYDFTRNKEGMASETADVGQSTAALVDQNQPAWVNQSTAALVDQSTAALVDDPQHAAFGHGTMVAGIIHLVAPRAMIMPLKAFKADGAGYLSDILRAVYRAVQNNAKILNMSFSLPLYSSELKQAVNYADRNGVISVASVGNSSSNQLVYPAAFENVIGVASTSNSDQRSSFSNFGQGVWVAAPGEGIVTTYPYGAYAAAWGTSFSAPFVSGAAALLLDVWEGCEQDQAAAAVGHAKWISSDLGKGRLDLAQALQFWVLAAGSR